MHHKLAIAPTGALVMNNDIFIINESKIDIVTSQIFNSLVTNYSLKIVVYKRKSGGVAIYVNNNIIQYRSTNQVAYSQLTQMAFALLSCFHGPAVESSFSVMQEVMTKQKSSPKVANFSAIQTVKYELQPSGKTSLEYFKRDDQLYSPVNIKTHAKSLSYVQRCKRK